MPIINPTASAPPAEQPNTVTIAHHEYKGVVVDTKYVPLGSLLTHVEGSSWTVQYYSQVLDNDSALAGQNVTRNPIYQQYKLVKDFEFKVTTALTTSQDDVSKAIILTGSANVYPFIIPNEGDMFLADIGDGREGVFRILTSERKSVFKDTVHFVEYQLIDYSTEERRGDLNAKVVQSLHFVRDFLSYGQNPLLEEEDFNAVVELQNQYEDIVKSYFKSFTSTEFKTLIVPGQNAPIYDHFIVNAMTSICNTYESPELRYIRKLNCDGDDNMKVITLWGVLIARDKKLLKQCTQRTGLILAGMFDRKPMFEGIHYSGFSHVVYPIDPIQSEDNALNARVSMVEDKQITDAPVRVGLMADFLATITAGGVPEVIIPPLLHKVTIDNYYILSQAFYNNTNSQSKLELCIRDYLDRKSIDNKILLSLCDTYYCWGNLEKFYFTPLLMILIKASVRGF